MATVSAYERPATIEEALVCLAEQDAVAVGGGTKVNATRSDTPVTVVDLQALGLDGIEPDGRLLRIGATATLQQLADDHAAPIIVRCAARREQPSTLRAAATVGGCVAAADRSSELVAALLVHEATVTVLDRKESTTARLDRLLQHLPLPPGSLLTSVTIETSGETSASGTGRTRADRPIVAAFARRTPDGRRLLALTGVAATPILVEDAEALEPPGDFRGSSEYRRALAVTLSARALAAVA